MRPPSAVPDKPRASVGLSTAVLSKATWDQVRLSRLEARATWGLSHGLAAGGFRTYLLSQAAWVAEWLNAAVLKCALCHLAQCHAVSLNAGNGWDCRERARLSDLESQAMLARPVGQGGAPSGASAGGMAAPWWRF